MPSCGDCTRLELPCAWPAPPVSFSTPPAKFDEPPALGHASTEPLTTTVLAVRDESQVLPGLPKRCTPAISQPLSNLYTEFHNALEGHVFRSSWDLLSMLLCPPWPTIHVTNFPIS